MSEVSTSKISARAGYEPPPPVAAPAKHKHPAGVRDVLAGHDDQGRRIVQTVPARIVTYRFDCKACQQEDAARMAAPPTLSPADYERTIFLVTDGAYDGSVARAYIKQRYGGEVPRANVVSAFHAEKLAYVKDVKIIVFARRGKNGEVPGPSARRQKDAEEVWKETPIPPDTYIDEVVESSIIDLTDCLGYVAATMFTEQSIDLRELVDVLSERAYPHYIAIPTEGDKMYAMRG